MNEHLASMNLSDASPRPLSRPLPLPPDGLPKDQRSEEKHTKTEDPAKTLAKGPWKGKMKEPKKHSLHGLAWEFIASAWGFPSQSIHPAGGPFRSRISGAKKATEPQKEHVPR